MYFIYKYVLYIHICIKKYSKQYTWQSYLRLELTEINKLNYIKEAKCQSCSTNCGGSWYLIIIYESSAHAN